MKWYQKHVGGVLLDITGVIYDSDPSGGGTPIQGSIKAVQRLKSSGLPLRFVTNETTITRESLAIKLSKLGFDITMCEIFTPISSLCKTLNERCLRPFLVTTDEVLPDFADVEQNDPNCVVLADAESNFSYENLTSAFQVLMRLEKPILFALGKGKYYKSGDQLVLDVGPYMRALEYACDIQAEVIGKPESAFFNTALEDMKLTADQCVMIGDDIVGDIGGAQSAGLRGVLVRTGKYRPQDACHPTVKPDGFVDNLEEAVNLIIGAMA